MKWKEFLSQECLYESFSFTFAEPGFLFFKGAVVKSGQGWNKTCFRFNCQNVFLELLSGGMLARTLYLWDFE